VLCTLHGAQAICHQRVSRWCGVIGLWSLETGCHVSRGLSAGSDTPKATGRSL
jgi:hypothetical protein